MIWIGILIGFLLGFVVWFMFWAIVNGKVITRYVERGRFECNGKIYRVEEDVDS